MKKNYLILLFLISIATVQAQLINDGGSIVVESGATVFVEGDIVNQSSGTIINSGTIEIQEDLTNSATITSSANSKVIFSGAATSTVDAGGATFAEVEINKSAGVNVVLTSDMTIDEDLNFVADDNLLDIGANDLTINEDATISSYDDNEYVSTTGTGSVIKERLAIPAFEFPVGNGNYTPVSVATPLIDDISVRVLANPLDAGTTGAALTMDVADAAWVVSGNRSDYDNRLEITPQWNAADNMTGLDLTNLGVARWDGTAYDIASSDLDPATGSGPYTATKNNFHESGTFIIADDAFLKSLLLAAKAILSGPHNGTVMNDDLRVAGIIPTTEPYTAMTQFTHVGGGGESVPSSTFDDTGDNNNIVDWMFIELRDKTDNTSVVATRSALIQKDGDIVDVNGGPVSFAGVTADDYYVAIRHRNHLGVMSSSPVTLSSTSTALDFTSSGTSTYGTHALRNNGGTMMMWWGDCNSDGTVKYQSVDNDVVEILNAMYADPGNFFNSLGYQNSMGYKSEDVNMDGIIRYQGINNDKVEILNAMYAFPGNFFNSLGYQLFNQQLPN